MPIVSFPKAPRQTLPLSPASSMHLCAIPGNGGNRIRRRGATESRGLARGKPRRMFLSGPAVTASKGPHAVSAVPPDVQRPLRLCASSPPIRGRVPCSLRSTSRFFGIFRSSAEMVRAADASSPLRGMGHPPHSVRPMPSVSLYTQEGSDMDAGQRRNRAAVRERAGREDAANRYQG